MMKLLLRRKAGLGPGGLRGLPLVVRALIP